MIFKFMDNRRMTFEAYMPSLEEAEIFAEHNFLKIIK